MKMTGLKMFGLVLLMTTLSVGELMAQFNTIVPMLPTKNALVFAKDGRQVEGKVTGSLLIGGQLKSLTIKDEAGEKHKFKAEDVLEVRAQLTGLEKLAAVSEAHSTDGGKRAQIMSIINATQDDIWKKDLIIYYQVEVKPGKFSLMQLLNPGTNTVISVYPLANTQGTDDQYYLAVKGNEVTKVVKKDYAKETYAALFGDCAEFMRMNPVDKKMKVDEFESSVTEYNKICASK